MNSKIILAFIIGIGCAYSPKEIQKAYDICLERNTKQECDSQKLSDPYESSHSCCVYCDKGIPCGNSCISSNYSCHSPPGCAC